MAKQYFDVELPYGIASDDKKAIAEEIISYIIKRTREEGLDKDGNKLNDYTEAYAEKKGVRVSDVDLTLSSEMLDALDYVVKGRMLRIGYTKADAKLNGKVEGNITGSYGRDPDPSKARDFLGIDEDTLENILAKYREDLLRSAPQLIPEDE